MPPHPRPNRVPRLRALAGAALLALLAPVALAAQEMGGGPGYEPLNPNISARSPLGVIAWRTPATGWAIGTEVEYGSAVERGLNWPALYLFDAELMRLQLRARRELRQNVFVEVRGGVTGTYDGVFDAFFDRFHHMIGWVMQERDTRPHNVYGDRLLIPAAQVDVERGASPLALSDLRLELGWHAARSLQPVLLITLPTAPSSSPYHRGVATIGAGAAFRSRLSAEGRVLIEGSAAVAHAPAQGDLAPVQRTRVESFSIGPRMRLWRGHELYGTFFYHSPAFSNTGFAELDRPEMSADIGYDWRQRSGRRIRISIVEDLRRRDPAIDLIVRVAVQ